MNKLKIGTYTRKEIAELTETDIKDTRHFKRNLINKLENCGYSYIYSKNKVEITAVPEEPIDKLKEILITEYNFNKQCDFKSIAYFLYALFCYEDFMCMPWRQRAIELNDWLNIKVSESTLHNWKRKLLEKDFFKVSNIDFSYWCSYYAEGEKYSEMIDETDEKMKLFLQSYLDDKQELLDSGKSYKDTFEILWKTKNICFYKCFLIEISAIAPCVNEIEELVINICEERGNE